MTILLILIVSLKIVREERAEKYSFINSNKVENLLYNYQVNYLFWPSTTYLLNISHRWMDIQHTLGSRIGRLTKSGRVSWGARLPPTPLVRSQWTVLRRPRSTRCRTFAPVVVWYENRSSTLPSPRYSYQAVDFVGLKSSQLRARKSHSYHKRFWPSRHSGHSKGHTKPRYVSRQFPPPQPERIARPRAQGMGRRCS